PGRRLDMLVRLDLVAGNERWFDAGLARGECVDPPRSERRIALADDVSSAGGNKHATRIGVLDAEVCFLVRGVARSVDEQEVFVGVDVRVLGGRGLAGAAIIPVDATVVVRVCRADDVAD